MTIVSYPGGAPLNWSKIAKMDVAEAAKLPVQWLKRTNGNKTIRDCLFSIAHLEWMNEKAKVKFGNELDIIQAMNNKDVPESAGTHDYGFCRDYWIENMARTEANGRVIALWARNECGCADWNRTPAQGFSNHVHGFPYPPGGFTFPVAVGEYVDGGMSLTGHVYTSSQLADSWVGGLGLKGQHDSGDDPLPWPTRSKRRARIFDLSAFIKAEVEKSMPGPADWTKDDWDAVRNFLETEPMIDLKDDKGQVKKTVSVTDALQREVNEHGG